MGTSLPHSMDSSCDCCCRFVALVLALRLLSSFVATRTHKRQGGQIVTFHVFFRSQHESRVCRGPSTYCLSLPSRGMSSSSSGAQLDFMYDLMGPRHMCTRHFDAWCILWRHDASCEPGQKCKRFDVGFRLEIFWSLIDSVWDLHSQSLVLHRHQVNYSNLTRCTRFYDLSLVRQCGI